MLPGETQAEAETRQWLEMRNQAPAQAVIGPGFPWWVLLALAGAALALLLGKKWR